MFKIPLTYVPKYILEEFQAAIKTDNDIQTKNIEDTPQDVESIYNHYKDKDPIQ